MAESRNIHSAHKECIIASAEEHQKSNPNLFKLQVLIPASDGWEGVEAEWLWTTRLAENEFEIRNIPVYAYGLSLGDVASGTRQGSIVQFGEIVRRGGHSTYRIIFNKERLSSSKSVLAALRDFGCDIEQRNPIHFAIDVPPQTNADAVYKFLEQVEQDEIAAFEEGHSGHPVKET